MYQELSLSRIGQLCYILFVKVIQTFFCLLPPKAMQPSPLLIYQQAYSSASFWPFPYMLSQLGAFFTTIGFRVHGCWRLVCLVQLEKNNLGISQASAHETTLEYAAVFIA